MRTYAPAPTINVLERALAEPSLARGVLHHEVRPARDAEFGDWPAWLDPRIRGGLAKRGIERPYVHQAEAIEAVHAGEDLVVVTPTASGKSLCYTVPVLQALAEDPSARALFLFPTKALGRTRSPSCPSSCGTRGSRCRPRATTATRRRRSGLRCARPGRSW
jgi:DEAD/DEAH box helicase domain-containing protein